MMGGACYALGDCKRPTSNLGRATLHGALGRFGTNVAPVFLGEFAVEGGMKGNNI